MGTGKACRIIRDPAIEKRTTETDRFPLALDRDLTSNRATPARTLALDARFDVKSCP